MVALPRWANLRIRTKLTLVIEGAILLLGAGTGMMATVGLRNSIEAELTTRGLAAASDLALTSVRPLLAEDLAALRRVVTHATRQDHVQYAAVLDAGGRVVMHSDLSRLGSQFDPPGREAAATFFRTVRQVRVEHDAGAPHYDIYSPITAAGVRLGSVAIGYSRTSAEAAIQRMQRNVLWTWLIAAGVGGLLAFVVSSYLSRPLTHIADAMRRAPVGEAAPVAEWPGRDEIGLLVSSYNDMAVELARHRQHLTELVEARTAALREANARLEREVAERGRVEGALLASRQELRDLASHLQEIREQERAEAARDIHDELGQALTVLKMDVHWVAQRARHGHEAIDARLQSMSTSIDATVQAVRRISSRLRPQLLDDLGLSAAIEWQAREFERHTGIACHLQSDPDDIVLDSARSTALFRIFQETLTNVARHAQGSRVDVTLTRTDGHIEMTVSDDGKGAGLPGAGEARSFGLLGMRERARALGGTCEIAGQPGRGTTVTVSLPC